MGGWEQSLRSSHSWFFRSAWASSLWSSLEPSWPTTDLSFSVVRTRLCHRYPFRSKPPAWSHYHSPFPLAYHHYWWCFPFVLARLANPNLLCYLACYLLSWVYDLYYFMFRIRCPSLFLNKRHVLIIHCCMFRIQKMFLFIIWKVYCYKKIN